METVCCLPNLERKRLGLRRKRPKDKFYSGPKREDEWIPQKTIKTEELKDNLVSWKKPDFRWGKTRPKDKDTFYSGPKMGPKRADGWIPQKTIKTEELKDNLVSWKKPDFPWEKPDQRGEKCGGITFTPENLSQVKGFCRYLCVTSSRFYQWITDSVSFPRRPEALWVPGGRRRYVFWSHLSIETGQAFFQIDLASRWGWSRMPS